MSSKYKRVTSGVLGGYAAMCWVEPIYTSSTVNPSVEYVGDFDKSCRTLWLLVNCAQRT